MSRAPAGLASNGRSDESRRGDMRGARHSRVHRSTRHHRGLGTALPSHTKRGLPHGARSAASPIQCLKQPAGASLRRSPRQRRGLRLCSSDSAAADRIEDDRHARRLTTHRLVARRMHRQRTASRAIEADRDPRDSESMQLQRLIRGSVRQGAPTARGAVAQRQDRPRGGS